MICPCGRNVLYLVNGRCKECKDVVVEPPKQKAKPKMGRPVGEVPYDKKTSNATYYEKNRERLMEYNRNYKRIKKGTVLGRFIIRSGFQYVQHHNNPKLGARSTAKIYSSLAYAQRGAARIEGAVIEKKDSVI